MTLKNYGKKYFKKDKLKKMQNENRNMGLDILRIMSMMMIVLIHYFGNSGMLEVTNFKHISNLLAWFLEAMCIVAVNCYVLISSFFLIKSKFKLKKVIKLVIEVLFYTLGILILFIVFGKKDITVDSISSNMFPILTKQYWFITVYLAMYILSPYLNKLLENISKDRHRNLIIVLIIISYVFDKTHGYSLIWFVTLYFIGAYIKLYQNKKENKRCKYILIYLSVTIFVTITKYTLYELYSNRIIGSDYSLAFYHYNSITILISSICLFMFFKDVKIKNYVISKIILFISPLTFGVYLIHEHPYIREVLYTKILHCENYIYSNNYIIVALLSTLIVYISCSTVDYIRSILFKLIYKVYANVINKKKIFL